MLCCDVQSKDTSILTKWASASKEDEKVSSSRQVSRNMLFCLQKDINTRWVRDSKTDMLVDI